MLKFGTEFKRTLARHCDDAYEENVRPNVVFSLSGLSAHAWAMLPMQYMQTLRPLRLSRHDELR